MAQNLGPACVFPERDTVKLTGAEVFLGIMRARHPEHRWRLLSEDERREYREASAGQDDARVVAAPDQLDPVVDRCATAA